MFEMDSKYTLFEVNVKAIAASYYKEVHVIHVQNYLISLLR